MDRPELMIHLAALEPLRLELVIGLQPLDRFTELVEIADGLAIAVGIKEPLHSRRYYGYALERISVLVQSFPGSPELRSNPRAAPPAARRCTTEQDDWDQKVDVSPAGCPASNLL